MKTIISLFDYKKTLDFKSFVVALISSLVVFLLACWVLGFILTMLGQKSLASIFIMFFAGIFLARMIVLLMRLILKNKK